MNAYEQETNALREAWDLRKALNIALEACAVQSEKARAASEELERTRALMRRLMLYTSIYCSVATVAAVWGWLR